MSKGWIVAGAVFFLVSCALGGLVMARLQGLDEKTPSRTFSPDGGS